MDVLSSYELPNEYKQADDSYYIDKDLKKLNVAGAVGYVFPIFHKINLKWELSTQNYDSWIDQNVDSEHLNSHNFGFMEGLMKNKVSLGLMLVLDFLIMGIAQTSMD